MQTALPSGRSPLASYAPAPPIPDTSHSRSATTPPLSPSSYVLLLGKLSFNISVCTRCPPRNLWHRTPRRPIFVSLHTHGLLHPLAAVVLLYESCCIARGEKSHSRGCNNFEGWKRYNFASDDLLGLYHLYKIWSRLLLIEE